MVWVLLLVTLVLVAMLAMQVMRELTKLVRRATLASLVKADLPGGVVRAVRGVGHQPVGTIIVNLVKRSKIALPIVTVIVAMASVIRGKTRIHALPIV